MLVHPHQIRVIRTYTSYSTFLTQPGLFVTDRIGFGDLTTPHSKEAEIQLRGLASLCCQHNYGQLE